MRAMSGRQFQPHEFPWVAVDKNRNNTCPLGSVNPGHWKRGKEDGWCRCYDAIYIFNWDTASPLKE